MPLPMLCASINGGEVEGISIWQIDKNGGAWIVILDATS